MGEVLVVAWELKQSKNFTQGRPKWAVVANHKLLTKLFGDRTLAEIENTKLFSLMQRTLPWYFEIMNMLGKTNSAVDGPSRYSFSCHDLTLLGFEDSNVPSLTAKRTLNIDSSGAVG